MFDSLVGVTLLPRSVASRSGECNAQVGVDVDAGDRESWQRMFKETRKGVTFTKDIKEEAELQTFGGRKESCFSCILSQKD